MVALHHSLDSTMAVVLLHSTWLHINPSWLYFSVHTLPYLSFALLHSISPLIYSTWFYFYLPWLNSPLPHSSLYLTLPYSVKVLLHSTWHYFTSLVPRPPPVFCSSVCNTQKRKSALFRFRVSYWTQTEEKKKRVRPGNEATTLPWLYIILLDCTSLYRGSTSLYLTVHHCTMALLHST